MLPEIVFSAIGLMLLFFLVHLNVVAAFLSIFAIGSIWFWILLALASAAILGLIENEDGVLATACLIAFVMLLPHYKHLEIAMMLVRHWLMILIGLFLYFGLGMGWSVVKWWEFCLDTRREHQEERSRFFAMRTDIDPSARAVFWKENCLGPDKPDPDKNKARIIRWMTFWPWSLLWTFVNDPVRKFFLFLYRNLIVGVLRRIADKVWADL